MESQKTKPKNTKLQGMWKATTTEPILRRTQARQEALEVKTSSAVKCRLTHTGSTGGVSNNVMTLEQV